MFGNKTFAQPAQSRFFMLVIGLTLVALATGFAVLPLRAKSLAAPVSQAAVTVLAVISSPTSTILDQPDGDEVLKLDPGAVVTAFGRTEDSDWLAVRAESGEVGWIQASAVVIFGVETLAVLDPANALPSASAPASAAKPATAIQAAATATTAPKPSPTNTPTTPPTATAAPTKTATPAPTATQAPATQSESGQTSTTVDGIFAIVSGKDAQLKDTPTGDSGVTIEAGTTLTLIGRNEASDWLRVMSDNGDEGWVSADEVVAYDLPSLPVVDVTAPVARTVDSSATTTIAVTTTSVTSTNVTPTKAVTSTQSATSSTTTAASGTTVTVQTGGAQLRVRFGPGTSYGITGGVANGSQFTATGRDSTSNWVQVDLGDGETGWLSAGFLSVDGSIADLPLVPVAAGAVNVQPTVGATTTTTESTAQATTPAAATQSTPPSGLTGKIVVSSGGGGMFYVYNLATGSLTPVTGGYDPAISPDGTRIAFTRAGGENGVYVVNVDGSNEQKLYGGNELLTSPKWNADGSKIVFSQLADSNTTTTTCRSPGFGICLPDDPEFEDFPLRTATRTTSSYGLARVTVADKEYRDLAVEGGAEAPDWDNDNIIYRANRGFKITMDKPEVTIRTVTEDSGFQDPDLYGNRIVYQSKSGNHWEIMVMNDDASGQTFLTRPVTTLVDELPNNVAPAWSPDGKYIVFLGNRQANNEAGDWGVWVMNADGSNQQKLPIDINISYGYAQEQMVSWGK